MKFFYRLIFSIAVGYLLPLLFKHQMFMDFEDKYYIVQFFSTFFVFILFLQNDLAVDDDGKMSSTWSIPK